MENERVLKLDIPSVLAANATAVDDAVYAHLPYATQLPVGRYRGIPPVPLPWEGKVFRGDTVRNIIMGVEAIEGHVELVNGEVFITYPRPLRPDRLKPLDQNAWLGRYESSAGRVYFVLERE